MATGQRLYRLKEAAAALGVSRDTLYRLMNAGELSYVRLRGVRMIRAEEIERFVKALPAA